MKRTIPSLEKLGSHLKRVDGMILSLLRQRIRLAAEVEESKRSAGLPIIRREVEDRRMAEMVASAKEIGLNPHFIECIYYMIISEACRTQIDHLQDPALQRPGSMEDKDHQAWLRANLLELTAAVAPHYEDAYRARYPAMAQYLRYEEAAIRRLVSGLAHPAGLALDLGCATGACSRLLAQYSEHVIGYDVSPDMIRCGNARSDKPSNVGLGIRDIEGGLPLEDGSVDFALLSLGTASDLRDFKAMWREVGRTLRPGGRFLFSFYNADALLYSFDFLPWLLPLAASLGSAEHTLEVRFQGKTFEVHARPYRSSELLAMAPPGIEVFETLSYPTLGSLIPSEAFGEDTASYKVAEADHHLAGQGSGAYILLTGQKRLG